MPLSNHRLDNFCKYTFISSIFLLMLYLGQVLFIPMFYGLFIAIVLYPFCSWLQRHSFSKSAAIASGLLIVVALFTALLILLQAEFSAFRKDLPELKIKIAPLIDDLQQWVYRNLDVTPAAQNEWWHSALRKVGDKPEVLLSGAFNKTFTAVFMLVLAPVFAVLFLYNRTDFAHFVEKAAGPTNHHKARYILRKTVDTYFHFIKGMGIVYIIVGILNSIGLLALGIRHAILFGFITAVMTMIPYIGIFVSALLPITVAWITKDSIWYPVGVVAVFTLVQYLEANIIFPRVVGAQLNLSTWATLVAVIGGGILWGISGMILFIPLAGIVKIITDDEPGWEAINILLRRKEKNIAAR